MLMSILPVKYRIFTHIRLFTTIYFILIWLTACSLSPSSDDGCCKKVTPSYFVDAHTQLSVEVDTSVVLERMSAFNVEKSILAARGGRTSSSIADFGLQYPNKIVAAIKVKGEDYNNDTQTYYDRLASRGTSTKWNAIGEVLIYHAAKGDLAPEVDVSLFDNRVTAALDVAVARQWPFIIHIEFAALNSNRRSSLMADLKTFLELHPNQPMVMIHMAQLQSHQVRELIQAHNNIYFMTSHTNPAVTDISSQPWTEMFDGGDLKPEWLELMIAYPAKFIFALDNVWPEHWDESMYQAQITYWLNAAKKMPEELAEAFGHGNAETLWAIQ